MFSFLIPLFFYREKMAFFTRLNTSVSLLAPSFDDEEDTVPAVSSSKQHDEGKSSGGDDFGSKGELSEEKPRLTSAQFAEQRLAQLRSHEVRNLTLAELQRLQHLTSDVNSRRLTLAELQKLQQQAPIVDSRHAELLKPRVSFVQRPQEIRPPIPEPTPENVKRLDLDYDLELGVEV